MARVKLGDPFVAEISSGQAAPQNQTAFSTEGIPFIRAGSLEVLCSGGDEDGLERVTDKAAKQYKLRLFPADTIVFAKSGMSAKIPRIYRLKDKCYLVSHLAAIIPCTSNVYPNYLEHYLKYNHPCSLISNDSYPSIRLSEIEEFEVILPPLDEQKKISEIFDAVDKLIHRRRLQLSKLDQLVKARFVEMFGDPVRNEKGWPIVHLEELAEIRIGPFGSLLHKEDYIEGGHALINPSHIVEGKICADEKLTVSYDKYKELSAYHLKIDDIVLGRRGEMGRCAVVHTEGLLCGTGSMIVRPNNKMKPYFLQTILSSPTYKMVIEDKAVGVTMMNLNVPIVSALPVPLLPLDLQEKFIALLQKVDKSKTEVKQSLEKLETLKKSLMQEYFG